MMDHPACPPHPASDPADLDLLLSGWGISLVEVFYRMPDHRNVLNTLVLQMMDQEPDYPKLFDFIDFWKRDIDGPIHSIRFAHYRMLAPRSWRHVVHEIRVD